MIEPTDVLVLMPCSATKREQRMPAIDLYDGPLWQTLRTHLGRIPACNVCVLSGKYGFVNATTRLAPYEGRLSPQRADRLIGRGVTEPNDHLGAIKPGRGMGSNAIVEANGTLRCDVRPYRAVICAGAGDYARVLQHFRVGFIAHGLVAADALSWQVCGGIGEQRQQLGQWLNELQGVREWLGA